MRHSTLTSNPQSLSHTQSYWLDSAPPKPKTSPIAADTEVETCVIGAGIAGLTTAYFLAKQRQKVVVLDTAEICAGETGRTTGYLTWVVDDGVSNVTSLYGVDGASMHVSSHQDAVSMVERIAKEEGINCGFRRVPGYWISRKPKAEQDAQPDSDITKEFEAMEKVGMKNIEMVDHPPYAHDDGPCIKIPNQGQFHSIAYCYGISNAIMNAGGTIFTNSKVVEWKGREGNEDPYVKTANGFTVKCKNLVMATNVPLQLITTIAKLEANRTYVVGGQVPKGKYEWCIFQDDSMINRKPYKYGRFASYNDTHDMLLIGGEDNLVGFETGDSEEKYQNLEKWGTDRYPDIKFTYRWSGQVQEPVDYLAYIGKDPGADNVYIITGDSGMGITHGTIGGKLISDIILGTPNPWKQLYDPSRLSLKTAPEMVRHLAEINMQYKDYFTGGDVADVEDIVNGEGAIVCKGIHRYAVYKDYDGKLHACSATCPHMKGQVRWNPLEKSWDCPVHGSRFNMLGQTINGPAKSDLEKVAVEKLISNKK